jgi:hypothetical protein
MEAPSGPPLAPVALAVHAKSYFLMNDVAPTYDELLELTRRQARPEVDMEGQAGRLTEGQ